VPKMSRRERAGATLSKVRPEVPMATKLTRQGVRDLNDYPRAQPPRPEYPKPYLGAFVGCSHPNMQTCCPECCGHCYCPDCGLTWDDYAGK